MSTLDWILAEFKALGWYCVKHGPEFWLVVPIAVVVLVAIVISCIIGRNQ